VTIDITATLSELDALDCPICGKERRPVSVNRDGNVTYVCRTNYDWQADKSPAEQHGSTYTWRITAEGDLID